MPTPMELQKHQQPKHCVSCQIVSSLMLLACGALAGAQMRDMFLNNNCMQALPIAGVITGKMGITTSTTTSTKSNSSSSSKHPWPGIPSDTLPSPLVKIRSNFVDHAHARKFFLDHLQEFIQVYNNRPDKVNMGGICISHAFAVWLVTKSLNPTFIIESGVNADQSTYFFRNAAPNAKIYAIDPLVKPICGQETRWTTNNSVYFTGDKFQDLRVIDWNKMIATGEIDQNRTLVFLDDHQRVYDRFTTFMKLDFRHIMLEDNYKFGKGATGPDKAGVTMKQMFFKKTLDSNFLFHQLISYTKIPTVVPPIMAAKNNVTRKVAGGFLVAADSNTDIMPPILRPDGDKSDNKVFKNMCRNLGLDPEMKDMESYMQLMSYNQICYMELRQMSPYLNARWNQ